MFALQCLSCEHDNPVGAKFCVECGSPLNLKLCKHCEAINEATAPRCHNCATEFPAHSVADQARGAQGAGSRVARAGPLRRIAVLSALLLAAIAGLAYSLYRQPAVGPGAIDGRPTPSVAVAPGAAADDTPVNPSQPPVTHTERGVAAPAVAAPTALRPDVKPPPAVSPGAAAEDTSTADATTAVPPVSRSQPPVTHTRGAVAAPIATRPDVKPPGAVSAGAAAPDASSADSTPSALPVSRSYPAVTHTKGAVAAPIAPTPEVRQEAAVSAGATMVPAAAAQPPASESRVSARQDQPSSGSCTEVAAALGLCIPNAKGEGN